MAARGIAFQPVAHQTVKAVESLAHVRCTQGHVDPGSRPKSEQRLHLVQYSQQTLQCRRIESRTNFDPATASRLNHKCAIPINIAASLPHRRWNHFNRNHRPACRSSPTMNPSTIFIQRSDGQVSLPAELVPHQSTRFKLRNQSRSLRPATPSPHHSNFAHDPSASLNDAAQQSALV